jgi:hypothetical protein
MTPFDTIHLIVPCYGNSLVGTTGYSRRRVGAGAPPRERQHSAWGNVGANPRLCHLQPEARALAKCKQRWTHQRRNRIYDIREDPRAHRMGRMVQRHWVCADRNTLCAVRCDVFCPNHCRYGREHKKTAAGVSTSIGVRERRRAARSHGRPQVRTTLLFRSKMSTLRPARPQRHRNSSPQPGRPPPERSGDRFINPQ